MSTTAPNIFIGVWQNHNEETWPTWTLTLKQRDGGILSAALVLFVGFAATQGMEHCQIDPPPGTLAFQARWT
ncbi:hypothetical protein N7527_008480 [Penicillium freii]|nr:hypothetical protein N7527_008480 [Penicillium freii]